MTQALILPSAVLARDATPAWGPRMLRAAIVPALLLLTWQALAMIVGSHAVATPAATWAALVNGLQRGNLGASLMLTLRETLIAGLLASSAGIVGGFLLGRRAFWREVLEAPAVWIYSLPKVILYPVLVLLFGLGARSNIAFAVLQGFFPPFLIMTAAVADLPAVYVKLARVQRLSGWKFFRRIVLPHALPSVAMGMRYCFSLTYIGIVVAEMFAAENGIGFDLIKSITLSQTPRMFAIVTLVTVVALGVNFIFQWIEQALERRRGALTHSPESLHQ